MYFNVCSPFLCSPSQQHSIHADPSAGSSSSHTSLNGNIHIPSNSKGNVPPQQQQQQQGSKLQSPIGVRSDLFPTQSNPATAAAQAPAGVRPPAPSPQLPPPPQIIGRNLTIDSLHMHVTSLRGMPYIGESTEKSLDYYGGQTT